MPTGRVGLGASNRAGPRQLSSLVPITGRGIQRAVVAMCVSGANCRHRDAPGPRRLPHCRAKRTWARFWDRSAKVARLPAWYGQTHSQGAPPPPLPARPSPLFQPSLCASSVLPAAGSPRAQAPLRPTGSESPVCAPLSAPRVCVLSTPLWVACPCLFFSKTLCSFLPGSASPC